MIPCTSVAVNQVFGETCCVLLRGITYPETLLSLYQTTWHHISKYSEVCYNERCNN